MTRLIAPCKDCEERQIGCHSTCEKYLQYRALKDKQNKDRVKQAFQDWEQNEIERERKRKMATGKFGGRK